MVRLERRLSQEALALEAGIDRTYMGGLECGIRNPSVEISDRLAEALSVKTAVFFEEVKGDENVTGLPRGRKRKNTARDN
ncbi:MAG: helix-turn-helix transcriptional regulator [Sphingomonadales bacterium]|jgi:transcriptional regulator with XRE-family HTH domain